MSGHVDPMDDGCMTCSMNRRALAEKDARIAELEEACRRLGTYFYEANGEHGYNAIKINDAKDAIDSHPLASTYVRSEA